MAWDAQGEAEAESPPPSPLLPAAPLSTFGGFGRPYGQRTADDSINVVRCGPSVPQHIHRSLHPAQTVWMLTKQVLRGARRKLRYGVTM